MIQIELKKQRSQRGFAIAQTQKVIEKNGVWIVPSQSNPMKFYRVGLRLDGSRCACQDFALRGIKCKHIFAVEITIRKAGALCNPEEAYRKAAGDTATHR